MTICMEKNALEKALASTLEGEQVAKLNAVYQELDTVQEKFNRRFHISCMEGCGECCKHYIPVLSEAEAMQTAKEIMEQGREEEILERLKDFDPDSICCPLYNADKSYHCGLYSGRSLVCRLFGNAASEDKNHKPVYRSCKWKTKGEVIAIEELEANREEVPVMSYYGDRLLECNEGFSEGESLVTAIPKALSKLMMVASFSSASSSDSIEV